MEHAGGPLPLACFAARRPLLWPRSLLSSKAFASSRLAGRKGTARRMPVSNSPSEMEGSLWSPTSQVARYRLSRDPNIWLLIVLALYAGTNGLVVQLSRGGWLTLPWELQLGLTFVGPAVLLVGTCTFHYLVKRFQIAVLMVFFITLTLLLLINLHGLGK